jgi:hypothetical protein
VVTDARVAKRHTGMASEPVDLDGFLREIIKRSPAELMTLLSAYAERDAAAVFRLAAIADIDLPAEFPQVIFRNCDQRPFFEMVKEAAAADTGRIHLWSAVFAEAALRSRVVANVLNGMAPWPGWDRAVAAIPRRQRWFQPRILRRTFLTECLSLAIRNHDLNDSMVLLRELRGVPPPATYRPIASRALRLMAAVVIASMPALVAMMAGNRFFDLARAGLIPLLILVATVLALPLRATAGEYQRMLSLDDSTRMRRPLGQELDAGWLGWFRPPRLRKAAVLYLSVREVHGTQPLRARGRSLSGRHTVALP